MMADGGNPSTLSIVEWMLGLAGAVQMGIIGYIHTRLTRIEDNAVSMENRLRAEQTTFAHDVRVEMTKAAEYAQSFREKVLGEMVTKVDLRETEKRITSAINPGKPHNDQQL